MRGRVGKSSISSLAALTVFTLFAACALCVLLSGAGVFRRLVARGQESYALRTCTQYISTRVRQCENGARLRVEPFGETQALVLEEDVDGEVYVTVVYCHDGWLRELFFARNGSFSPQDGEKLIQMEQLRFACSNEELTVSLTDQFGVQRDLFFSLTGREEGSS